MKKTLLLCALAAPIALAGCAHPNYGYGYGPPAPPPPAYNEIGQRGFHDGFDAARHDISEGRPPNAEAHKRFRNPPVPPQAWEDYRQGFREGYRRAMHEVPPPAR
jgi:hypothetical protein